MLKPAREDCQRRSRLDDTTKLLTFLSYRYSNNQSGVEKRTVNHLASRMNMIVVTKSLSAVLLLAFRLSAADPSAEILMKIPTEAPTTPRSRPPQPFVPIAAQSNMNSTLNPTQDEWTRSQCHNYNDGWKYTYSFWGYAVGCESFRVTCNDMGNFGVARDHCCKCKPECAGYCNDPVHIPDTSNFGDGYNNDDETNLAEYSPIIAFVLLLLCLCSVAMKSIIDKRDLRATRQTMNQRRQQQRELNNEVLSEEERKNARYELFVNKFHFQKVLPDKSNTTADRLRGITDTKDDEDRANDDVSTEAELNDNDDDRVVSTGPNKIVLPYSLASSRKTMAKEEPPCCICLESYIEGETICVPTTTQCDHVFHEGCIYEWLKTKDRCPLCRVELL